MRKSHPAWKYIEKTLSAWERDGHTSREQARLITNDLISSGVLDDGEVFGGLPVLKEPAYSEENCPGHVASKYDGKVCGRCGVHIDSLRP